MGLNRLSVSELDSAVEAYHGFEQLFGRDWVLGYSQGALGPLFVRATMSLWQDWLLVSALPNADQHRQRWRQGKHEAGVQTEVVVCARLIRGRVCRTLSPVFWQRSRLQGNNRNQGPNILC